MQDNFYEALTVDLDLTLDSVSDSLRRGGRSLRRRRAEWRSWEWYCPAVWMGLIAQCGSGVIVAVPVWIGLLAELSAA